MLDEAGVEKYLVLTCDTEAHASLADGDHVDRLIWGRHRGLPYAAGIELMMSIVESHDGRISFFLDVCERERYGEKIDQVARAILDRGHDVQLHLHAEYVTDEFWCQLGVRRPTWGMHQYDVKAADAIIGFAVDHYVALTGERPMAYRAGSYRFNRSILQALATHRIPISSQYYPLCKYKFTYPHGCDLGPIPLSCWSNGVIEAPVGCVPKLVPDPTEPYNGFEFHHLQTCDAALTFIDRFCNLGPEFQVLVMVLHSWDFFDKSADGQYVWKDKSRVRLLDSMLGSLPHSMKILTMKELARKIESGEVRPVYDLPIDLAGMETIPLIGSQKPVASTSALN